MASFFFFAFQVKYDSKISKQHTFWLLKKNNHLIKHVQTTNFGEIVSDGAFLISCFFVFMINSLFIVLLVYGTHCKVQIF